MRKAASRKTSKSAAAPIQAALKRLLQLRKRQKGSRLALESLIEQPFDDLLLTLSPLYQQSRRAFLQLSGHFYPALLSSARALSSAELLEPRITYTPLESELLWTALDPREPPERLLELRSYCTHVFHEQNHRRVWSLLPPLPTASGALRRALNFAESLVIAADLLLSQELGPQASESFYAAGVLYHPHAGVLDTFPRPLQGAGCIRAFKNTVHAVIQTTYLHLEGYTPSQIRKVLSLLFGSVLSPEHQLDCLELGLRLDQQFVERTNPFWQNQHRNHLKRRFAGATDPLILPTDPLDNRLLYLWAERWLTELLDTKRDKQLQKR
jgi:hypothetical protein